MTAVCSLEPEESALTILIVGASDAAMEITTDAAQVLGGYAYGKDYPVERTMRDAEITQISEGTNQVRRIVIARKLLERY